MSLFNFGQTLPKPAASTASTAPGTGLNLQPQAAATAALVSFSFGAPAGQSLPKLAASSQTSFFNATATAASATGLNLQSTPATTAAPGGFLSGASAPSTGLNLQSTPAATPSSTGSSLFNFGQTPPKPAASLQTSFFNGTSTTTPATGLNLQPKPTTTAAPVSLFSGMPAQATGLNLQTTPAPTAARAAGLNFQSKRAATAASTGSPSVAPIPATGLNLQSTSAATTFPASLSSGAPAQALQSLAGKLKFSDLDQLLNRLAIDLQEQDNRFQEQMEQVNKQDMLLFERQQDLEETIKEVDALERDHFNFLTHVEMLEEQQNEAKSAIEELEKSLGLSASNNPQQPGHLSNLNVDVRRAAILQLLLDTDVAAKQLDNEIDDATQQLQSVINLKDSIDRTNDIQGNSPVEQLQAILNAQMSAIARVETECESLSKQMHTIRSH